MTRKLEFVHADTVFARALAALGVPVTVAGGLLVRALVAALALGAGQVVLARLDTGARAEGCLPVVGRGARVGYGWLTLQPVVPCADGTVAPSPLTAAAVGAALAAVGAALAIVVGQLSVALSMAFVWVRFTVVKALLRLSQRLDLSGLLVVLCAPWQAERATAPPTYPGRTPARPRRRLWTTQLTHRGPPMTFLPHPA